MTLKDRCTAMFTDIATGHSTVEDLRDFVLAEIGRAADARLDDTEPLVLYFGSKSDRDELVAAVHAVKPGMIERKWPR